jgi:hypothetical protein
MDMSTRSICCGKIFTPRTMSMSSDRPVMRLDAPVGAAAGAGFGDEGGEVARAIAQERHGFAVDAGEDQFAGFPFGTGSPVTGLMISRMKLSSQRCMPHLCLALEGDAGAVHFGQAVGVIDIKPRAASILRRVSSVCGSAPTKALRNVRAPFAGQFPFSPGNPRSKARSWAGCGRPWCRSPA